MKRDPAQETTGSAKGIIMCYPSERSCCFTAHKPSRGLQGSRWSWHAMMEQPATRTQQRKSIEARSKWVSFLDRQGPAQLERN
ncbi:hypothetical protein CEP53_014973 [Fusarium sp. AF-6]|nr:hypothetical protein CEP53_014973 [Fusarium sp. AF-6]